MTLFFASLIIAAADLPPKVAASKLPAILVRTVCVILSTTALLTLFATISLWNSNFKSDTDLPSNRAAFTFCLAEAIICSLVEPFNCAALTLFLASLKIVVKFLPFKVVALISLANNQAAYSSGVLLPNR